MSANNHEPLNLMCHSARMQNQQIAFGIGHRS